MNNHAVIRKTIEVFFKAQWALQAQTPEVKWPNVKFSPVEGAAFVAISILPAIHTREAITGARANGQEQTGIVVVQVFTPENEGMAEDEILVDQIDDIFNEQTTDITAGDPIVFGVATPLEIGNDGNGYHQTNVDVPYKHHD